MSDDLVLAELKKLNVSVEHLAASLGVKKRSVICADDYPYCLVCAEFVERPERAFRFWTKKYGHFLAHSVCLRGVVSGELKSKWLAAEK